MHTLLQSSAILADNVQVSGFRNYYRAQEKYDMPVGANPNLSLMNKFLKSTVLILKVQFLVSF